MVAAMVRVAGSGEQECRNSANGCDRDDGRGLGCFADAFISRFKDQLAGMRGGGDVGFRKLPQLVDAGHAPCDFKLFEQIAALLGGELVEFAGESAGVQWSASELAENVIQQLLSAGVFSVVAHHGAGVDHAVDEEPRECETMTRVKDVTFRFRQPISHHTKPIRQCRPEESCGAGDTRKLRFHGFQKPNPGDLQGVKITLNGLARQASGDGKKLVRGIQNWHKQLLLNSKT